MNRARARRAAMLVAAPLLAMAAMPGLVGRPASLILAGLALCVVAAAILAHDLTSFMIPDRYVAAIAVLAIAIHAVSGASAADIAMQIGLALAVGVALYAAGEAYARLRGVQGLGFGDVKLLSACVLLVGIVGVGIQLLLASLAAIVFVVLRSWRKGRRLRARMAIPFGAFLAPAAVLVWAWGPAS